MTVNTLLLLTFALMSEDNDTAYYDDMIMPLINFMFADLFEIENSLRADDNQLTAMPYLYERTDTIPYQDVLARIVMPIGLAYMLFLADDEYKKSCMYQTMYDAYKLKYFTTAKYVDMDDYYKDTTDED